MARTTTTRLKIPSKVMAGTTKCQKGFACLTQPVETLCKIKHTVTGKVLCIQCASGRHCAYKFTLGNRCYCTCPTRLVIYTCYGI